MDNGTADITLFKRVTNLFSVSRSYGNGFLMPVHAAVDSGVVQHPGPLVDRIKDLAFARYHRHNPTAFFETGTNTRAGIRTGFPVRKKTRRRAGIHSDQELWQILPTVARGDVHFGAAGLIATHSREKSLDSPVVTSRL